MMMMSAQKVVGAVDMMVDGMDGDVDEGEDEIHWDVAETGIAVRVHRYHFGTMGLGDTAAMCYGAVVVGKYVDVDVGVVVGRTNSHSTTGDMTPMIEWAELPAAVVPVRKDWGVESGNAPGYSVEDIRGYAVD